MKIRLVKLAAVPEGHGDNSPAFQRRDLAVDDLSPEGTAGLTAMLFLPSLRDLRFVSMEPGIEMPGYFQKFLRNLAAGQPQIRF